MTATHELLRTFVRWRSCENGIIEHLIQKKATDNEPGWTYLGFSN